MDYKEKLIRKHQEVSESISRNKKKIEELIGSINKLNETVLILEGARLQLEELINYKDQEAQQDEDIKENDKNA